VVDAQSRTFALGEGRGQRCVVLADTGHDVNHGALAQVVTHAELLRLVVVQVDTGDIVVDLAAADLSEGAESTNVPWIPICCDL
jgi:hypothetical protein